MIIETHNIGTIEYSESDIITFEEGLYGFSEAKEFVLAGEIDSEFPFQWLQSINDPMLSFVVTSPFLFVEQYDFELPDAVVEKMDLKSIDAVMIYCLTVIPDDAALTTINLKAPIVINKETKQAKQIILNEEYEYKYRIFKQ